MSYMLSISKESNNKKLMIVTLDPLSFHLLGNNHFDTCFILYLGIIEMWDMWDTTRIWTEKFSLHIHIAALQFASDWNVIWHSDFISFRHDHLVILLPYWEGGLAVGIRGLQYKLNNRQMGEEYRSCGVNKSSIIPLFNIQIFILMNLQQILALFALKLGVPLRNPTILNIIRWDDGSTKRLSNVYFDTVVCILVRIQPFSWFWRNHP